jgi:hypothetical protein
VPFDQIDQLAVSFVPDPGERVDQLPEDIKADQLND